MKPHTRMPGKTFAACTIGVCVLALAGCGGGGSDGGTPTAPTPPVIPPVTPPATTYTVAGSVNGLSGSGLVLQNNAGNDLSVATAGVFSFSTALATGAAYVVTVKTQPTAPVQSCTVTNGSGTIASANISTVSIQCVTPPISTAQEFRVLPARMSLMVGDEGVVMSVGEPSAVIWSSSNTSIATVNARGVVQALAKGSVSIRATAGTAVLTSAVTIYQTGGLNPDATGESLIAQALAQGRINAETALIYRVYNLFGDSRLPGEFNGAPSDQPNHALLTEVSGALPMLSPAAQVILVPFLIPPIYVESWYAQQLGTKSQATRSVGKLQQEKDILIACSYAAVRSVPRSTAHFNIYNEFHTEQLMGDDSQPTSETEYDFIASIVEDVYDKETEHFGRFPMSDVNERCNGGDGAVDVYFFPLPGRTKAITASYPERCEAVPSFIILNAGEIFLTFGRTSSIPLAMKKRAWISYFAHEFLHVLQLRMDRSATCKDYDWFDEATANWVMDFIDNTANFEEGDTGDRNTTYERDGRFLANYLYNDHRVTIETPSPESDPELNGYSDYLFFQYIARKKGADTIARMMDATLTMGSVEAMASVVESNGGMKTNWPDFAATLWNDKPNANLDYWNTTDKYDFGLAAIYSPTAMSAQTVASTKLKSLEIDQHGQPNAKFKLLENANDTPGPDYLIQPRSMIYEHLKFTDSTVSSVYLLNPIAVLPNRQFIKLQAVKKIGGQWKPIEDWTGDSFKQFCRDKKDERLEELILIVSNSEANRGAEQDFRIDARFPMQVSTSNVGCWKWQGTATTTIVGGTPSSIDSTASGVVTFEVASSLPGRIIFDTASGTISARSTATIGECTITSIGSDLSVVKGRIPTEGTIDVNLDIDLGFSAVGGEPPNRKLVDLQGFSTLFTTNAFVCPGFTQNSANDAGWEWLRVEDPSLYSVSSDGKTIEGEYNATTLVGAAVKSRWKFTSIRE